MPTCCAAHIPKADIVAAGVRKADVGAQVGQTQVVAGFCKAEVVAAQIAEADVNAPTFPLPTLLAPTFAKPRLKPAALGGPAAAAALVNRSDRPASFFSCWVNGINAETAADAPA